MLGNLGKKLLFFDGGMGTLLQKEGLLPGELPENWNIEKKEAIRSIIVRVISLREKFSAAHYIFNSIQVNCIGSST